MKKGRKRRSTANPVAKDSFLTALSRGLTVSDAADLAGVAYSTIYSWRRLDPDFAEAWDLAYRVGGDALETEANRRAVQGVEEPVYYLGKVVGHVRKYSDVLLIMLMKARNPEKFCDRARTNRLEREAGKQTEADKVAGEGNGAATLEAEKKVFDALDALAAEKAATAAKLEKLDAIEAAGACQTAG